MSCEGEEVFSDIASYLLKGESSIDSINGIYYRDNEQIHKNAERKVTINLDKLPFNVRKIH